MDQLPVSVIIPTYNRAGLILKSLSSVLAAMDPGDEVIVVDDGSTDNTRQVLEPYFDRIRYVPGPHSGVGAARNCGIAEARNPLVAFNDSDDEWFADKLPLQRALMQARPDIVFCFSDLGLRDKDGTESHHGLYGWHLDSRSWDEILAPGIAYSSLAPLPAGSADFQVHIGNLYLTMLRRNYVPTQSAMVRSDLAGGALRFSEDISTHEDHECFTRLSKIGPVAYFDRELVWQCGHDGPRLTEANDTYFAMCRLKMLERTFGTDQQFLAEHGKLYEEMLRAEHITIARNLIRDGHPRQARTELQMAGGGVLAYRVLASLPAPLIVAAVGLRRWISEWMLNIFFEG